MCCVPQASCACSSGSASPRPCLASPPWPWQPATLQTGPSPTCPRRVSDAKELRCLSSLSGAYMLGEGRLLHRHRQVIGDAVLCSCSPPQPTSKHTHTEAFDRPFPHAYTFPPPPPPPAYPICLALPGEKLDARAAIAGRDTQPTPSAGAASSSWQSGLFDRGSWMEAHAGWARTVVTGRARLGGIPVGVIAVEVNTVMLSLPADPGMPDSSERVIPQVGWGTLGFLSGVSEWGF